MAPFNAWMAIVLLSSTIFVVNSLPTVRKENDEAKNTQKEANAALEAELGKLKQDGVAVQKTEQTVSETVNGKTKTSKTEKETVADAKTGEVVATVSKTVTNEGNGQRKEEAHVDVPAAGVHQDISGAEAENFELLPPDDVARYIFDTSDIDGVKTAVQSLVEKKKISKKAADDYVQEIRGHLNAMQEEAMKEVAAELEERKKEEDSAYKDMLSMAETLSSNSEIEQALYQYVKKLYTAYRVEGDEYAKEVLTQFTNVLQEETEKGNLNEAAQNSIYDIVLRALKDVNDELQTDQNEESADSAPAAEGKSKLRMQYNGGRRTSFGSATAGSRLSVPVSRRSTSTRTTLTSSLSPSTGASYSRYSSAYSTPSPSRPYTRVTSPASTGDQSAKYRTSRYDNHYSSYDKSKPDRYISPASNYVTGSSGVTTSRESSLSKSWPSPARNLAVLSDVSRYDSSVRSSSSTVAATVSSRTLRSPVVVGGSVPALSTYTYANSDARRNSARSIDLALDRSPSSRRLSTGTSGADGNFDAGRAETLYRPSNRYLSAGSNRFLSSTSKNYDTHLDILSGGISTRRSSLLSTSSSMSRSPGRVTSPSPGPVNKTLWNKHYNSLTARWAEQTGSQLNTGKNQYSYRPNSALRRTSNGGTASDSSVMDAKNTNGTTNSALTNKNRRKKTKEDSDGYDSSSSSDEDTEKSVKAKLPNTTPVVKNVKPKRTATNGTANSAGQSTVSNRRSKNGQNSSTTSTGINRKHDDKQPSSSDNETAQDSLDARIKARRKRLQKSKAMLQEHKEDTWNYRRTLQIEQSKQRQQTSTASTISYTRNPNPNPTSEDIKKDAKSETSTALTDDTRSKFDHPDILAERKSPQKSPRKSDTVERSPDPRSNTPSKSVADENASFKVQKVYLQPLKSAWKNDPSAATQSDQSVADQDPNFPKKEPSPRVQQLQNEHGQSTASPAAEKSDTISVIYRRSPMQRASPMTATRGISNERTPPPPISQRQDFNYNEYVSSIAPKQVAYENPSAALIEADQQQRISNANAGAKKQDDSKKPQKPPDGINASKSNNPAGDHTKVPVKTKPVRTQPPSVVVVTPVSPSTSKRAVNSSQSSPMAKRSDTNTPSNSLNSVPTPFKRASASPARNPEEKPKNGLTVTASPKLPKSPEVKKIPQPIENGDQPSPKTADRSTPTVTVIPLTMIPGKCVPEKITPMLTPTFRQPSPIHQRPSPGPGFASKISNAPKSEELPTPPIRRSVSKEITPAPVKTAPMAVTTGQLASKTDENLNIQLKKQQTRDSLRKESLADMHRLPSVDREMLNLLTLGEELNNSRTSLSTVRSQTPNSQCVPQQNASKFAQSFRTAMPQKCGQNPPLPPRQSQKKLDPQGSKESLNSYNLNVIPKPWKPMQRSREGSSESISSFATAASNNRGSKEWLSVNSQFYNSCPKPWFKMKDKLSSSAEPLATLAEMQTEVPLAPPRGQRNTNSLELATKKVEEMLRIAKLKHQQQKRRDKFVLLQSQMHPHNLTVITTPIDSDQNPISDASKELDKVYEAIQLDYAEAQESRQRHKYRQPSYSDNENVFVKPQLVTVFSTIHMPSPKQASDHQKRNTRHEASLTRRNMEKGEIHDQKAQIDTQMINAYDKSKLDYTKRWLEGDLRSFAHDTKPDLLQFGSAPRLDFDQRSVGSASAEVAAITNKDRLRSMRAAVPDLVPAQHQITPQQKPDNPQLVKPAPVVALKKTQYPNMIPLNTSNFPGPRVGQAGSKSSSFAGGLPSLQNNSTKSIQHPGQKHQTQRQSDVPLNLNSGSIRQAVDQLRASADSLAHSDKSWGVPPKVGHGHVRLRVDMFDRMSDNDSELSFRSADNVAYRSVLYKPSRRLSLTDHMSNFVRRFESDEESNHGNGGNGNLYRRVHQPRHAPRNDMHSDDEARLASFRNSNLTAQPFKRSLNSHAAAQNNAGSTQSLPVAIPQHYQQKLRNAGLGFPGAPGLGSRNAQPSFGHQQMPARSVGYLGLDPQNARKIAPPPWLRGKVAEKNTYWSSNSTLTDMETPSQHQIYNKSNHGKFGHHSNDTMQAVDSLVAELELNTDASGSIISQRSTNNFPVDRYYYPYPSSASVDVDRSSSRSKLNVIHEQAEQQNPLETLHLAQKRLEEARRDLKQMTSAGQRRQIGMEKPRGLLEKPMSSRIRSSPLSHRHHVNVTNTNSLPRSMDSGQHQPEPVVKYRQNKPVLHNRPASYAAPSVAPPSTSSSNPILPMADRKHSLGNSKEEDNYDNILLGAWRGRQQPPEPPRSAVPSKNLHSPNTIKIGSIVLGKSADQNEQQSQKFDKQPVAKNPLRNFLQFFNKSTNGMPPKPSNGEMSSDTKPHGPYYDQNNQSQRSPGNSSFKTPSTLSLNVASSMDASMTNGQRGSTASMTGSMMVTSMDGSHFHKSQSTNDAYTLKPGMTVQEMRQLDELLTSFHEDSNANEGQKKTSSLSRITKDTAQKQEPNKSVKTGDKPNSNIQDQKSPSKFRLGLPAFWKRT